MAESLDGRGIGSLAKDSLFYGLGNVGLKAGSLLLVPILTRALAPAEYGTFDLLMATVTFASMGLTLGLDSALWRYFFEAESLDGQRTVIATAFSTQFALCSAAVLALILTADRWAWAVTGQPDQATNVRLAIAGAPFLVSAGTIAAVFRFRFMVLRFNLYALAQFGILAALNIGVILAGYANATWLVASTTLAYLLCFLLGLAIVWRDLGLGWSGRLARAMLSFGLPLVPAGIALWSLSLLGRIVVAHLRGPADVALLALASRLTFALTVAFSAFQVAWAPFSLSIAKRPDARQVYADVLTYLLVGGVSLVVGLSVLARPLILLVATPDYLGATPLVPWLGLASVGGAAYYVTTIGASIIKRSPLIAGSLVAAAAANGVASLALVTWFGVEGAAVATFLAFAMSAFLPQHLTRRSFPVPFSLRPALLMLLLGIVVAQIGARVGSDSLVLDLGLRLGLLLAYAAGLLIWLRRAGALTAGAVWARAVRGRVAGRRTLPWVDRVGFHER